MKRTALTACAVLGGLVAALSGCTHPQVTYLAPTAPPWSPTITTDPVTGTTRCVVAAYDRVAATSYTRTGYLYPIVEFHSEHGLLVGVSSGGLIRFPVGDIVWRVDAQPYRELRAIDNPTQIPDAPIAATGNDAVAASIADTVKLSQRLVANATSTATVASDEKARAMLDEMLADSSLIFRVNRPNTQLGLPTVQEQQVGQWTSEGQRPIPLDATFHQAVEKYQSIMAVR